MDNEQTDLPLSLYIFNSNLAARDIDEILSRVKAGEIENTVVYDDSTNTVTVELSTPIGPLFGFDMKNVQEALLLAKHDSTIKFLINSPGGVANIGLQIYNRLVDWRKKHPEGTVEMVVEGTAGSAATLIASAASPGHLKAYDNTTYLIHRSNIVFQGNGLEFKKMSAMMLKFDDTMAGIYAERSSLPKQEVIDMMDGKTGEDDGLTSLDTTMTAQEAVDKGLIDVILTAESIPEVKQESFDNYKKALEILNFIEEQKYV